MAVATVWTQAATNLLAALNVGGAPATTYRARFEAVGQNETAFNLFPARLDCKYTDAHDSVTVDGEFVIRIYVDSASEVDLALDPLVLWAWRQVRADPTLGGVVADAYVASVEIGYLDKSASDQVCADMTIRVQVEVSRDDPSVNMLSPA
jgi:hypothetical protein